MLTEEQNDLAKKETLRQRMNMYKQELAGQMEEARLKKKYDNSLMTEHERRVHDNDIKAYVEMDN